MKSLFTLIELIVVIVVISILAAIVIPNVGGFQREAENTAVQSNLRNLQTTVDMYALENLGTLPGLESPTEIKPSPIDFGKIYPEQVRNIPKTKNFRYWVDFQGKVWASKADSPIIELKEGVGGKVTITWIKDEEAMKYNIYELVGYQGAESMITSSINKSNIKLKKVAEEIEVTAFTEAKKDTAYVVSALDIDNFESAPSGMGYEGYPEGDNFIVISNPNVNSGSEPVIKERQPIQKEVPAGWIPIYTVEDLNNMRNLLSGKYILMNNLDLNVSPYKDGKGWIPVGRNTASFRGQFDGNGLSIKNLTINNSTGDQSGLFGYSISGVYKNLYLENVNIDGGGGGGFTGSLVGYSHTNTIENVHVTGVVKGKNLYTGGLVGYAAFNTINDSSSIVNVTGAGNLVGGFIGGIDNGTIVNRSYSKGNVVNTGAYWTGGFAGRIQNSIVSDSYSVGNIQGVYKVGGFAGEIEQTTGNASVKTSYSVGSVTSSSSTTTEKGGFAGVLTKGTVVNSYYDMDKSILTTTAGGTGLTTTQMYKQSSYSSWNFTDVWKIKEGTNYPYLRWQDSK